MENVVRLRRELHKMPELGFCEHQTANFICHYLDKIGVAYQRNIAKTGIVAIINGKNEGKTLAIRADMDGLEMVEENKFDYKSKNEGRMHACGHDGHMAILLSVCEKINEIRDSISGNVKFIFQPAEEVLGGAKPMIEAGILENPKVDCSVALHLWPELESGFVQIKDGEAYASPDNFEIVVKGMGGHGAMPNLCVDPVVTGAYLITSLQTIKSRIVDPLDPFVLSVCSFEAGKEYNVIPDNVVIKGTVRTFNSQLRERLPYLIENIVKNVCLAHNADYDFKFFYRYPPVINDEIVSKMVYQVAKTLLGDKALWGGKPTMGGEDFAYFCKKAPSAIFRLGCKNEEKGIIYPLHSSKFDIDESCLYVGVNVLVEFVKNYLK